MTMVQSKTEWVVCARSGRTVQSFDCPKALARWLKDRHGNKVPYRILMLRKEVHEVALGIEDDWVAATLGESQPVPPVRS